MNTKKIANVLISFLIFNMFFSGIISFAETIDFSGGLLDGKALTHSADNVLTTKPTDNNIDTYFTLEKGASLYYVFEELVEINGFRILMDLNATVNVIFYGESGQVLYSRTMSPLTGDKFDGHLVEVQVSGVKKVVLQNKSTYYTRPVYEFNVYGSVYVSLDPPTQVMNVQVSDITASSVTITWNPNPASEKIQKYNIYLDDELYGETTGTQYTIDNLQPNTSYKITITAVNEAGEGPTSDLITFTTLALLPTKVMNVTVKNITDTSVIIGWDPNPESEGVLKYIVYLNDQQYGETTNTEYSIDNLQPTTSYEVKIVAVNSYGEGPASDVLVFTTLEPPLKPATQVKNVVVKKLTSTSATISWMPNPETEKITKYIIYLNDEKYGETEDTEYVIEGLKEGEKYVVTITAVNDLGEGPPSKPITFTTSKIADISNAIKVQDILSSIAVLFANLWPLLAFALALIAVVPITGTLKQIFRRRFNA